MPSPVDRYFKEIKKDNPSYSDEQAWATAWSIYCKHKNPGSDHCSKPPSEYLKGKSAGLTVRVATRYLDLVGMEHSSPEALKEYLHDHPNADPSKHTVEKSEDEEFADKVQPIEKKLTDKVKGWGAKAIGFLKKAPEQVKKFVADDGFRRECLMSAHKTLTEAPAKMTNAVIETAKHEVHEFKEAGAGVKAVLTGGKMSDSQKHAFKTVATHMAIGLAAAALTSSGPLAIAGAFGKGMARHIAFKAASSALGHLHVLDELGHIGHGIQHIFDKLAAEAKDADPDQVMANLVAAVVAKELEKVNDDDVKAVAEGMGEDGEKEATLAARVLRRAGYARVTRTPWIVMPWPR